MVLVQDEKKSGGSVIIDNKHFVDCQYIDCTLYYSGEDFEITNSSFANCKVSLGGPAQRTATFLEKFQVKFQAPTQVEEITKNQPKRKAS